MSNSFRLMITRAAEADIDETFAYISKSLVAPVAAAKLIDMVYDSLVKLADYPFSGTVVEDSVLRERGYRKLVVGKYIALYLVSETEKTVTIMRVLYGSRNYLEVI